MLIPPQGGTADVPVRFSTNLMLSFPSVLGSHAIHAGTSGTVAIVVRQVDAILGKPLRLVVEEPAGRGRVTVTRGISIR